MFHPFLLVAFLPYLLPFVHCQCLICLFECGYYMLNMSRLSTDTRTGLKALRNRRKQSNGMKEKKSDRVFYRCTTLCESNGKSIFDSILYSSSTEKKTSNKFNHIHLQWLRCHSLVAFFISPMYTYSLYWWHSSLSIILVTVVNWWAFWHFWLCHK